MQKTLLVLILAIVAVLAIDLDGDGFHSDNPVARFVDCCDTVLDGCEDPFMVNPGAYDFYGDEVVNNCDRDEYQNSNYCDSSINSNLLIGIFTGPGTLESNTEYLVKAMDICAIVDDDDDPTWGFLRQENMVVSLADGKRAGYDPYPTTSGPSSMQVTAKQSFGRIGPFRSNLGAVTALSTGWATDFRDAPNFASTLPPNPPINTGNDPASLPSPYRTGSATDDPYPPACGIPNRPDPVFDSVRLSFVVRQPTNAEAFAVKAKLLTNDMATYPPTVAQQCSVAKNYFVVLTNNTNGPSDKNIAKDRNGQTLSNLITDPAFWNNCDDYTAFPSNCDRSDIRLEFTDKLAASQWVSVGNRANRREEFRVDMILFQRLQNNPDMVVLLDDWQIIQEARTDGTAHGYQRTSDVGLDYLRLPGHNSALVPIGPGTVTYEYKVTNWGPERAGDVTLAFTPPFGTQYNSITLTSPPGPVSCSIVQQALAPFQDNSFYKCKLGNLENLTSFSGTLKFTLINPVPGDSFKFRVTASSSSIDVDQSNNYKLGYAFAVPR